MVFILKWGPRRLNIKIPSYQFRNFHSKDKTVSRLSCLYNGNTIPGKTVFILRLGPGVLFSVSCVDISGHCVSVIDNKVL